MFYKDVCSASLYFIMTFYTVANHRQLAVCLFWLPTIARFTSRRASFEESVSISWWHHKEVVHHTGVIMSAMAPQITSVSIVRSTVYSGDNQRKHQSSASLAFVRGNHRGPVNFPYKGPVTLQMFPFDDNIMVSTRHVVSQIRGVTKVPFVNFSVTGKFNLAKV